MATGNILIHKDSPFGSIGAKKCLVAAAATAIYPGDPVIRTLGDPTVTIMATNMPTVGTDSVVGIATTTSTQTASAAGEVWVQPLVPGTIYKIAPTVAATWDTQTEYDLLVGDRVLIDLTGGVYTILAADGSTYGCVIEWIDVAKNPGYVAFSFRAGCSDLA
jgi:hypothetical protein